MKLKLLPIKKILVFGTLAFSIQAASAQTNVFDNIIATSPTHTSLEAALIKAGLDDDLKTGTNLTVFAPDDAAFSAAAALNTDINGLLALPNLKDILLYHVLGSKVLSPTVTNGLVASPLSQTNTLKFTKTTDGKIFVNQAQVTTADINATNGVVHVINSVVLPAKTVVDVAIDNGFTTLAKAVIQAELLPALTNPLSTLTVFAPTDAAFSALATVLGKDVNGLLALPNLKSILLYHVLGSKVTSSQLINGQVVTLSGEELTVNTTNGVKIENATVTTADVLAVNGVVHIVDKVLLPPTVSGISNKKVTTFALYPNPAVDLISTDNYLGYNYQIFNTQGSLQEAGIAKETINISQLPTGSYIIKLSNEGTTVSSKFNKN